MNIPVTGWLRLPLALLLSATIVACSDSSDRNPAVPPPIDPEPPEPELTYSAEVVWTEYGIPHITADDWGSLGYGSGYALAKENYCVLMRAYVDARGESARYFGEEGNLDRDIVFKVLNSDEAVDRMWNALPEYFQDMSKGYVAGFNRYLQETGVDSLADGPEGCRGGDWVREATVEDQVRMYHMLALYGSSYELAPLVTAADPDATVAINELPLPQLEEQLYASLDREKTREALGLPSPEELGSNAYAVGADASQTNSGILFGNPHFPWQGNRRFFMMHTTLPGEYDAMGAGLIGAPIPVIGFNRDVAWSHTVSTAQRFTFWELTLNPENKMQYLYDGEYRDIESETVSVEQLTDSGTVETMEHTLYFSHFGPIVDLGAINPLGAGWPNGFGTLVTYRDVNLENMRIFDQFANMGKAADLDEFKESLRDMGLPWVNTIAADRYGDALYADVSTTPHVSVAKVNDCVRGVAQGFLTDSGILTMDGSDSACEWGSDPGVPEGIFNYDSMPKLETREYGANANDSYWLPNPRNLLSGFSPVIGQESIEQSKRTRHTFDLAERRINGQDGFGAPGFNIDNIRQMSYQATNYVAELLLQSTVDVCNETFDWSEFTDDPAGVIQACEILAEWDGAHLLDSVGAHIFFEYWERVKALEDGEGDAYLWSVPFSPSQPVGTPVGLNLTPEVLTGVRQSLVGAVERLDEAGIPLDRPWGEVQFDEKNGSRYGIHGGSSGMMFSVLTSDLVDGEGYSNIRHGNSYMQAITWDETDCPDAYAILTFSQSTDPASDHYADATELYSNGGWIDMPFCETARDEQEIGRVTLEE